MQRTRFDFDQGKVEQWFKKATDDAARGGHPPAGDPPPQVRVRTLRLRSLFVIHAKIVINRGIEAILLGSPFEQVYFDSPRHNIDDPRRGGAASKGPIHDVSVAVRGPAVGHLQEMFNLHWNLADKDDPLPMPQNPNFTFPAKVDPNDAGEGEFITSVQVVRTLDKMFTGGNSGGEKGILEAYLRAIHFAERFIYIENQYFKNDKIVQALIDALTAKPQLVVILLLNVNPDETLVPRWQRQSIEKIASSLKDTASKRFGVFSAWTHAARDDRHKKPRLVDNYLHTKTAIIDNRWATVGSANLDDASQDFIDWFPVFLDDDPRNSETNIVIFEDKLVEHSAVDALRRRLWAEHLGFVDDGKLNPNDEKLKDPPPDKNWLDIWNDKANEKLQGLILDGLSNNQDHIKPIHVLPWPSPHFQGDDNSHVGAKSYLNLLLGLGLRSAAFDVIGNEGPASPPFKYLP